MGSADARATGSAQQTSSELVSTGKDSSQTAQPVAAGISPITQAVVANQSAVSESKSTGLQRADATSATTDGNSATTGQKERPEAGTDQAASQGNSSDAGQESNQPATQGLNVAAAQFELINRGESGSAQAQSAAMTSAVPVQHAQSSSHAAASAAETPSNSTPASLAPAQAQPQINSARLIQDMGQTEMRVGMRSSEFGNISISTSATRDAISAQISVDHGELAKAIAAHLPEVQARLGGDQPMAVRIDSQGASTGHGNGTGADMSNGSADHSRSDRQQSGSGIANYSSDGEIERQAAGIAALGVTSIAAGSRLDITV